MLRRIFPILLGAWLACAPVYAAPTTYHGRYATELQAAVAAKLRKDNGGKLVGAVRIVDASYRGPYAVADAYLDNGGPLIALLVKHGKAWTVLTYGTGYDKHDFDDLHFPYDLYLQLHPL